MRKIEEYNENSIRGADAYTEQGETIKAAIHHCPYCKELSTPRNPHTPLHFCPTCGAQTEPVSDELPFDDAKNEEE